MSYIASEAVTLATSTDINSYRSVSGRSTIEISVPGPTFTSSQILALDTTAWKPVGAIDGAVSITPNIELQKIQSNQHFSAHAGFKSSHDWQISFTLQEVDIHNWALALGYKENMVESNLLDPDAGQNDDSLANSYMEIGGKAWHTNTEDAGYRSIRITTASAGTSDYIPGSVTAHQVMIFYKAMFIPSGSFDFDRGTAQSLPITAHCFGNDIDEVGAFITGVNIASRGYGS